MNDFIDPCRMVFARLTAKTSPESLANPVDPPKVEPDWAASRQASNDEGEG